VLLELGFLGYVFFAGLLYSILFKSLHNRASRRDKVYFWSKISIALTTLFISNTLNILQSGHFMTALLLVSAVVDSHFQRQRATRSTTRPARRAHIAQDYPSVPQKDPAISKP
jgi:O-antigen ligase